MTSFTLRPDTVTHTELNSIFQGGAEATVREHTQYLKRRLNILSVFVRNDVERKARDARLIKEEVRGVVRNTPPSFLLVSTHTPLCVSCHVSCFANTVRFYFDPSKSFFLSFFLPSFLHSFT